MPLTIVALASLMACGGSTKVDPYEKAVTKQEECCQRLSDARARSECVESIVRVDDSAARDSDVNRDTFRCVEKHFVCDPATGMATQPSSQAALDCISDLEE